MWVRSGAGRGEAFMPDDSRLTTDGSDLLVARLIGRIVHDFNTPLAAIVGFADLLRNPMLSAEKQERYGSASPDFLDRDLRRLFSDAPEYARNETAAAFLRRVRPEIRRMVSRWTGRYQYTLDQVLKDVITRSRELRLRLVEPPEQTKVDTAIMLTVQAMDFLYSGRRWISL